MVQLEISFCSVLIMTQNPTLGLIGQLRWVVHLCTTILTLTSMHTYKYILEIGVETLYMGEGVSEQDIEYSLKAKTQLRAKTNDRHKHNELQRVFFQKWARFERHTTFSIANYVPSQFLRRSVYDRKILLHSIYA